VFCKVVFLALRILRITQDCLSVDVSENHADPVSLNEEILLAYKEEM